MHVRMEFLKTFKAQGKQGYLWIGSCLPGVDLVLRDLASEKQEHKPLFFLGITELLPFPVRIPDFALNGHNG